MQWIWKAKICTLEELLNNNYTFEKKLTTGTRHMPCEIIVSVKQAIISLYYNLFK